MSDALIDAYAHVGLPRFLDLAAYRQVMAACGIGRAVLSAFDSSPDLAAIHAAIAQAPERFRGLGVPLGRDRAEMAACVQAQLDAGFSGLRLSERDVIERPFLLDAVADRIAIVCGQVGADDCARGLLAHLERHAQSVVVAGHFAGGGTPLDLTTGALAALLDHPRCFVVFSRQGAHEPAAIASWAEAILARTGWSRVMWGSEVPVLFWRDETVAEAIAWIDRLAPTPEQRAGFLGGTAALLYFARPPASAPLRLPLAPAQRRREIPAVLWARGLPVAQSVAGRLVQAWLAEGGDGTLGAYLQALLDRTLPR